MNAIGIDQLQHLQAFLEQLQDTFLLLDREGVIRYASGQARQLLGHRSLHGDCAQLLGEETFSQLCAPILQGESAGERWREIQLQPESEAPLDLAACSMAVTFDNGERAGAVIVLRDISGEVGLHRKYKKLLQQQRDINRQLRQHIAQKLREHEDDIAQFTEILQLAPSIFASFVSEAKTAVETAKRLLSEPIDDELLVRGFRAMHTLKGNARSLGLNLIGGRAHTVEDLLERLRDAQQRGRKEDLEALAELLEDVARAIDRACAIRERLGELVAQPAQLDNDVVLLEALATLDRERWTKRLSRLRRRPRAGRFCGEGDRYSIKSGNSHCNHCWIICGYPYNRLLVSWEWTRPWLA